MLGRQAALHRLLIKQEEGLFRKSTQRLGELFLTLKLFLRCKQKHFIFFWLWHVLKLRIPCENCMYRLYSFSQQESLNGLITCCNLANFSWSPIYRFHRFQLNQ